MPETNVLSNPAGVGGDFESALSFYLGLPNNNGPMNIDIDGKNAQVTHALPLAYHGKSLSMAMIVEKAFIDHDDWYTKKLLPWQKTDNINLNWKVWKFDRNMVKPTPVRGNPEMIQSSTSEFRDTLVRHSLGFMIDHEFWKTPEGHDLYLMSLECLRDAVIFSCYYLIIKAILTKGNQHRNWQFNGRSAPKNISDAIKKTYSGWAVINKGARSFNKYIGDLKEYFDLKQIKINLLALPPKAKSVLATHPSELEYSSGGAHAERVNKILYGAYDLIMGLEAHETTIFSDEYSDDTQPLMRRREYGSFWNLVDWNEGARLEDYRSEERLSIKILDAKSDTEKLVRGIDMIPVCGRFDALGNLSNEHISMLRPDRMEDLDAALKPAPNDKYKDMFIGYDHRESNGYFVMKYFGDMWDQDLRKSDITKFCRTAERRFRLTQADWNFFDDLETFLDTLNTTDDSLPDHAIYWTALSHSGSAPDSENYLDGTIFAKNTFGSVWPPDFRLVGDDLTINYRTKQGVAQKMVFDEKNRHYYYLDAVPGGGKPAKINKTLPLGFGNLPGLRTLAHMNKTDDTRGYDKFTLETAQKYVELIEKIYSTLLGLFPGHKMLSADACPHYHKTDDPLKDGATAFFYNIGSHFRTTLFARIIMINQGNKVKSYEEAKKSQFTVKETTESYRLTDSMEEKDDLKKVATKDDPDSIMGLVFEVIQNENTSEDERNRKMESIMMLMKYIYLNTKNPYVREALEDRKYKIKIEPKYRAKKYQDKKMQFSLGQFLTYVLRIDHDQRERVYAKITRIFTAVLEQLNERSVGQDWRSIISSATEAPVRIRSVDFDIGPFDDPTENEKTDDEKDDILRFINTRLTANNSVFLRYSDPNIVIHDDSLKNAIILPANPFNPLVALGIGATRFNNRPEDVTKGKNEMRFAATAMKRNTINSVTISSALAKHINNTVSTKRSLYTEQRNAGDKMRRVLPERETYVTSESTRKVLRGSLFDVDRNSSEYLPHETIPTDIAISRVHDLFSLSINEEIGGGESRRVNAFRPKLIERFHTWAIEPNAIHRILAQCLITTEINQKYLQVWWDADIWLPVGFQIHRIRQSYNMGSGFVAQGGGLLGRMCYGNVDFQLGDDIIRKMHEGHLTMWLCANIRDANRVAICEDILAMGYIHGETTSLIRSREDFEMLISNPDIAPGDMLVKMIPGNRTNPVIRQDVCGIWNPLTVMRNKHQGISEDEEIHGESVYFYSHLYDLHKINERRYSEESGFKTEGMGTVNTTVTLGHHRIWNATSQAWNSFVQDHGPFGNDVYAGCVAHRDICESGIKCAPYKSEASSNIIM